MQHVIEVSVQHSDFDVGVQTQALRKMGAHVGAIASFVGLVRDLNDSGKIITLELEHYPGMTQKSIHGIAEQACQRWQLLAVQVIHRVGKLAPNDQIVFVGVSSAHRADAFKACEFIMDYLKTRAPFWKKEFTAAATQWVQARDSDQLAADRWQQD